MIQPTHMNAVVQARKGDLDTSELRDLTYPKPTMIPQGVLRKSVGDIGRSEIRPVPAQAIPPEEQAALIAKTHTGSFVVIP